MNRLILLASIIFAMLLTACGGGGDASAGTNVLNASNSTTVTGTVTSTPVNPGVGGSTTVTAGGISIVIGFNDKITVSADDQQYLRDYQIKVVNSLGFPVQGILVAPRIDVMGYAKGFLINPLPETGSLFSYSVFCEREDTNGNDLLDGSETDVNRDGRLTPARATVSVQAVSGLTTNADGVVNLQLQYSKRFAAYLTVRLSVAAPAVAGTENLAIETFGLSFLDGDQENPGVAFAVSPFGTSPFCENTF
jgi:hypothetical protein